MNSTKTSNILLIVLLVLFVGSAIWQLAFANAAAKKASEISGNTANFTGNPNALAKKLVQI